MRILILGNGFDLANGLPTRYSEFLDFIESFSSVYKLVTEKGINALSNTEKSKYKFMDELIFEKESLCVEFQKMIDDNFWIFYFLKKQGLGENWIDFEKEIADVVKSLDMDMKDLRRVNEDGDFTTLSNNLLDSFYSSRGVNGCKEVIEKMQNDLNRLIRAFEIYLSAWIDNIEIENLDEDIVNIRPNVVLTFNYSNTFERAYKGDNDIKICHIHGVASEINKFEDEKTNIVIGIDEYLEGEAKNQNLDFVEFKKFYQRICKRNDNRYQFWLESITSESKMAHEVYIFGHSLDITDADILRSFIMLKNVKTTIFYKDKATYKRQIMNLIRMIGQENLIAKLGGKNPSLFFIKQKG